VGSSRKSRQTERIGWPTTMTAALLWWWMDGISGVGMGYSAGWLGVGMVWYGLGIGGGVLSARVSSV